jgi:hypothetical protein
MCRYILFSMASTDTGSLSVANCLRKCVEQMDGCDGVFFDSGAVPGGGGDSAGGSSPVRNNPSFYFRLEVRWRSVYAAVGINEVLTIARWLVVQYQPRLMIADIHRPYVLMTPLRTNTG